MDSAPVRGDLVIGAIPANAIEIVWDKVEPLIQMAIDKAPDDVSLDVVKSQLMGGHQMLITISRGAEIVAVNTLDVRTMETGIRVLYIPITAGSDLDEWMDEFLEIAAAVARDYECVELRGLAARQGWLKKLKPYGWEEVFTTIRYRIGEES